MFNQMTQICIFFLQFFWSVWIQWNICSNWSCCRKSSQSQSQETGSTSSETGCESKLCHSV